MRTVVTRSLRVLGLGRPALGRRLFDIDAGATVDSYPALASDGTLLVGTEGGELLAIAAG